MVLVPFDLYSYISILFLQELDMAYYDSKADLDYVSISSRESLLWYKSECLEIAE